VTVPRHPVPVRADADQLEKVLANLLGNALKFTPSGGEVRVRLSVAGAEDEVGVEANAEVAEVGTEAAAQAEATGQAVLTVADTGPGIGAAHLPFLFDRFYQVNDSASRHHAGTGIGLALVKELVALHEGTVAVASTEGQGSVFTVRLPLTREAVADLEPDPTRDDFAAPALIAADGVLGNGAANGAAGELSAEPNFEPAFADLDADPAAEIRPLVLVVDDHADMRAYVASCLRAEFRVLTAAAGEAGLAMVAEAGPDLVLSDLMMPGLDGLELCRRLKTDERTSHIPVVLLTARTADESRLAGLELGADDYLTKPFRPQELRARVRNLLTQRALLRRRFAREITLQPRDIAITSADEAFLTRALAVVEAEMANAEFDIEHFAAALHLSRIQLYRKLKALTDQAPTDFVRTLRLRRAAQLLAAQAGQVAEVAYQVGFTNLSYFSKCFRAEFGHPPSAHVTAE